MREKEIERVERESEKGGWRGNSPTIFIGNLRKELDKFGLGGIFKNYATIKSASIFRRWRAYSNYGFIEVARSHEALRRINRLNGATIRGRRIVVDWAKKKNRGRRSKQIWIPKSTRCTPKEIADLRVSGIINEDFVEWLSRSLICTSSVPRDLDALAYLIKDNYGPISKITTLSGVKYILTFPSILEMKEALANPMELSGWFSEIKPWSIYESPDSRKVWVDIIGVPPHGWVWENFESCAQPWGKLLSLARCISSMNQFEIMRALIQTDIFKRIDGEVVLDIHDCAFKVFIREVSCHLIPPTLIRDCDSSSDDVIDSSDNEESLNEDGLECHGSNLNVPDSPVAKAVPMPRIRDEGSQRDGSLSLTVQQTISGCIEGRRIFNDQTEASKNAFLQARGFVIQDEGGPGLEVVEEPEDAINLPLTCVPITNDQHLINMTAVLGSNSAMGIEKSVEVLNDFNHHNEPELSNQIVLPSSQNSDGDLSISFDCNSVVNARAFIIEKTIRFGEDSGFMRAKRNTNPRKYLEDKLTPRKRKKEKESQRRKKLISFSSASLSF